MLTLFFNMYSTKMGTCDDMKEIVSNHFQLSTVLRRTRTATTLSRTCVRPAKCIYVFVHSLPNSMGI